MAKRRSLGLTGKIILGMVLGIAAGIVLNLLLEARVAVGFLENYLVDGLFKAVGDIFIKSLKMLVVPLVFVSLVCGTCSLKDIAKLGRVGGKTLLLYLFTTAVAVALAITVANVIDPGVGFDLPSETTFAGQEAPSLVEVIIDMFPANPIKAMTEGKMLQIILFAILFGLAMVLAGEPGRRLAKVFEDVNAVIMKLIMMLMALASLTGSSRCSPRFSPPRASAPSSPWPSTSAPSCWCCSCTP